MSKGRSAAREQDLGPGGGPCDGEDTMEEVIRGCGGGILSHFPVASQREAKGLDTVDVGLVSKGLHTDIPADAHARAFKPSF